MATYACSAGEIEVVVDVAIATLPRRNRVTSGERKSHRRMIEVRAEPIVRSMARVAGGRETAADVIRIRRTLKIRRVTRITLRRHCLEFAAGRALVARIAIYRRVRSRQRKAIVVLLNLLHRYLPSANGVALLAVGSQLPLVNVRVTILTSLSHVAEYWFDVALNACHCLMHPP